MKPLDYCPEQSVCVSDYEVRANGQITSLRDLHACFD